MNVASLYNGPLEVGLRCVLILLEAYPEPLDLQRLVILDYLVVHSGDVPDGPPSLHPPSPLRAGEVVIRRDLVQKGLLLMGSRGLVTRNMDPQGIRYVAEELAPVLADALSSSYVRQLRDRARWAVEIAGALPDREANAMFGRTVERWRTEFVALATEDET